MKRCSTCRWWKDAGLSIPVVNGAGFVMNRKGLGYCEPERYVIPGQIHDVVKHHHGLTAEDYSCGEYKDEARGCLADEAGEVDRLRALLRQKLEQQGKSDD